MRNFVIAMLLGALPLAAAAQGVYKYTDKDGRVVYTDDPNAGGGTARPVEDTTTTISSPTGANDPERKLLEQAQKRDAALDRAVSDITAAYGSLREAEVRKEAGVEPVEGERQGRRYRPEYWQRQQALQRDVDVARARLNDALDRRNSLK
jgi:hypothetical protein